MKKRFLALFLLTSGLMFLPGGLWTEAQQTVPKATIITAQLKYGIRIAVPSDWGLFNAEEVGALDRYVGKILDLSKYQSVDSQLLIAANYPPPPADTLAIMNVRYYGDLNVTETDLKSLSAQDVLEFDKGVKAMIIKSLEAVHGKLVAWLGTKKLELNGHPVLISEYRRQLAADSPFHVQLAKFFPKSGAFTVTLSHKEGAGDFKQDDLKQILNSVQIK